MRAGMYVHCLVIKKEHSVKTYTSIFRNAL